MKKFPEYITTFLSYYLASTAITALMMFLVALLFFGSEVLPRNLFFIITSLLYYLMLIVLALFYFPHRQKRKYKDLVSWTLAIIFLHKLLAVSIGGIGGFIINGLHYSISSIVLANLIVSYLTDKDAEITAFLKVVKFGSTIYIGEALINSFVYFHHFYNHASSQFIADSFTNNPNEFIALQFAYYLGYLFAIYAFYRTFPLIKLIRAKLTNFEVVFEVLKILLAPFGVIAFLLALIFA